MQMTPMISRAAVVVEAIRSESTSNGNVAPAPRNRSSTKSTATPLLSVPKPSWVVTTQSNVWVEKRKIPDPPCVVCRGSGRVDCLGCRGRGRINHIELTLLPKGEWPKWCRSCGGSGLGYCDRCLGTGKFRHLMGFQFMRRDTDPSQDEKARQTHYEGTCISDERFVNDDQLDSRTES